MLRPVKHFCEGSIKILKIIDGGVVFWYIYRNGNLLIITHYDEE